MNIKKPVPQMVRVLGRVCPVCGKQSYSAAGIHPQCAVAAIDARSRARLKKSSQTPVRPR